MTTIPEQEDRNQDETLRFGKGLALALVASASFWIALAGVVWLLAA